LFWSFSHLCRYPLQPCCFVVARGVQGAGDRRPARARCCASGSATAAHDGRSRVARCSESVAAAIAISFMVTPATPLRWHRRLVARRGPITVPRRRREDLRAGGTWPRRRAVRAVLACFESPSSSMSRSTSSPSTISCSSWEQFLTSSAADVSTYCLHRKPDRRLTQQARRFA
jgi:hypothetical protein